MNIQYPEIFYRIVRGYLIRSKLRFREAFDSRAIIFIANHEQSFGPVAAMSSLPRPLLPWVAHQITDRRLCASYLEGDFVRPEVRLLPPLSTLLARIIGVLCVRIMHDIRAIPVYKHSKRIADTIKQSVQWIDQGKRLLIFPEIQNERWNEILCEFDTGFVGVARALFEKTRKVVTFFPVAVNRKVRSLRLGSPVVFDPSRPYHTERRRICEAIKMDISRMYREMEGIPEPSHREPVPVG